MSRREAGPEIRFLRTAGPVIRRLRTAGPVSRYLRAAAPLLAAAALCFPASGCAPREREADDGRLDVAVTLFPYYDFLREIAGDRIRLTLIVPAGMDSHSFEPTPADVIRIQDADLLVCNGGVMEQWVLEVADSFEEGTGPDRIVTMMDYVDVVEEEIVEGMEAEEHAHEDHAHGEENHVHEIEYDEHIWTSPVNAMRLTEALAEALAGADPAYADEYRENADRYCRELLELDREFRGIVAEGNRRLVVFGDKFPFRYFFEEYGLDYRAAFTGCSTDTEPSARTIAYLIETVRENQIPAVYHLELSSPRVSEIIGEETGAEVLLFHSCHNLTRSQFDSGITYLELMEENARNLRKGLE